MTKAAQDCSYNAIAAVIAGHSSISSTCHDWWKLEQQHLLASTRPTRARPADSLWCGRSVFEGSTRNTSSMQIRMLSRAAVKGGDGQCLRAQLPYIRSDLPILVVFRALGFVVRTLLPLLLAGS